MALWVPFQLYGSMKWGLIHLPTLAKTPAAIWFRGEEGERGLAACVGFCRGTVLWLLSSASRQGAAG